MCDYVHFGSFDDNFNNVCFVWALANYDDNIQKWECLVLQWNAARTPFSRQTIELHCVQFYLYLQVWVCVSVSVYLVHTKMIKTEAIKFCLYINFIHSFSIWFDFISFSICFNWFYFLSPEFCLRLLFLLLFYELCFRQCVCLYYYYFCVALYCFAFVFHVYFCCCCFCILSAIPSIHCCSVRSILFYCHSLIHAWNWFLCVYVLHSERRDYLATDLFAVVIAVHLWTIVHVSF